MRTIGAKDRKRRKPRTDKGRKRKLYAGKKTKPRRKKNGVFQTYVSKRKPGDNFKVAFWKIEQMPHESYMNFSKETRPFMHRKTYGKGTGRVYLSVPPKQLSTKENISEICISHLHEGEWLLMLWSHAKNRYHCCAKAFGKVIVSDHPEGLRCRVIPSYKRRSLRKFSFWKDK